jgi:hypothetical protein
MLLVSRKEFLDLGGFDPRFFLYYEDRDLSRRYRNADLPVRVTEGVLGRHVAGTSSASDGLRAFPIAWSLPRLGQYICIYDGEADRMARRPVQPCRRYAPDVSGYTRWPRCGGLVHGGKRDSSTSSSVCWPSRVAAATHAPVPIRCEWCEG